jgi:heat shock protein HtpX
MNSVKTVLLLGLLTGLLLAIGAWFGGQSGMTMALLFAAVMNFGAYWFSDKIVLAMHGAKAVDQAGAPDLYAVVANLAQKAGIPMPRLYMYDHPSPNAFATGRGPNHAAVAVSTGILKLMSREELEGVLAHELSHVMNRDVLISTVAATMAGAIMFLARIAQFGALFGGYGGRDNDREGANPLGLLFMAILSPIAAMLIQMAISRSREYQADASGAALMGTPYPLASALRKLGQATQRIPMDVSPAVSHLYIVKPFSGRSLLSLFSTHPPLEDRIARLLGQR